MTLYAHITGWGMAVPERIMTNHEMEKIVDTSDEWIRSRTGIRQRRVAGPEDTTTSLAVAAALKALKVARVYPSEIDLIIVATSSPEHVFPSTASTVQEKIGAVDCGAFDLLAACTGFIYGLDMATQSLKTGAIKTALVIGSETLSRIVNWEDRNTCILFGDGAGAFVLQASDEPGGIVSSILRSDGSGGNLLSYPTQGSQTATSIHSMNNDHAFLYMSGREVFRFATRVMAKVSREVVEAAGMTMEDIHLVIPHQANSRIIESAARGLKLPLDRFVINVDRYGNTSTASIPIATCEAIETGRLKAGDKIVLVGFGGGLTWGAATIEWTGPFELDRKVNIHRETLSGRLRSFLRRLQRRIEAIFFEKPKLDK